MSGTRKVYKDHLGREYSSINQMARAWGLLGPTLIYRLRVALTVEEALTRPLHAGIPARDHLGKDYPSMAAMAWAWGLNPRMLGKRLDKGWSVEDALTVPPLKRSDRWRGAKRGRKTV